MGSQRNTREEEFFIQRRLWWVGFLFLLGGLVFLGRLFQLQILDYETYKLLASDQHTIQAALVPKRGTIYLRDRREGTLFPLAKDRDAWQVFGVPKEIKQPVSTAKALAEILKMPEEEFTWKLSSTSSYQLLVKDVPYEAVEQLRAARLPGIGLSKGLVRFYPEQGLGGQVLGFVALDDKNQRVGRYGLEGFNQELLAGTPGSLIAEKDATGRRLTIGTIDLKEAKDGSDIVVTLDRVLQYQACAKMKETVERFEAASASVIIMDPYTGAILAMCSAPDFDPATFNKVVDLAVLNNPAIFYQFEPGSIFKPLTVAAGLDAGKIMPSTTYQDTGEEKIDTFTIRNSDKQAHGIQTMTQVLEKSLNTGAIHVQRLLGKDLFRDYMMEFGLGEKTNVELSTEVKGNTLSLNKKGAVFAATASYGQGIAVTPLQAVAAFAALGNGGHYMRPYIIQEVVHPDGTKEITKPEVIHEVISAKASRLISGMMVSVVENGHGKRAAVPGYYVAGKTGTAQIPDPKGNGYLKDANIGSFVGYAPADHPKFVMLVKVERPKDVEYAESSAAPVFGELAKFILSYLQVPPERKIKVPPPVVTPVATSTVRNP